MPDTPVQPNGSTRSYLCPSSRCRPGATLLGIVGADGRVQFVSDRIVVDDDFVQAARAGRAPEKRFRFGDACVTGACRQWTGARCGVIDRVIEDLASGTPRTGLPDCSIRPACRWYSQRGAAACGVCPEVITDLGAPEWSGATTPGGEARELE
jgi:hypothetical protein